MEITSISFYPYTEKQNETSAKILSKVSIVFEEALVLKGLKIIEGKFGVFVSWPRITNEAKGNETICFPLYQKFNDKIVNEILIAWKAVQR
jgi:DNA-binding cell septation regulator SpoVG